MVHGKKKILIVSSSFYPMNSPRAFRTTELVKEFARQGHDVTLLTPKNEEKHSFFEKEYGVLIKDLGRRTWKTPDGTKNGKYVKRFKSVINSALHLLFEYPAVELLPKIRKALENENGYDLLISIAVPHPVHWGVAAARGKDHPIAETWVADCGDPYMGFTTGRFKKPFYFKFFEKSFCRKADYISVPVDGAKKAYYPEFRDKIRVIPQGFDFDEIPINPSDYRRNDVPVFGYAGDLLGGGRDPKLFLDYITGLDQPFRFIIYTEQNHVVEPWLGKANGRIELRDTIPRSELLPELGRMDFLVNFENSTTAQMPSKLIDYYLAGRPVLSVGSKDIDRKVIVGFLEGNYTERYSYNNIDQYKIENVCERFLELCINK